MVAGALARAVKLKVLVALTAVLLGEHGPGFAASSGLVGGLSSVQELLDRRLRGHYLPHSPHLRVKLGIALQLILQAPVLGIGMQIAGILEIQTRMASGDQV